MAAKTREQTMLDQLGNPADVDRELQSFRRSARALSSHHHQMIDRYQKKWIAVHDGKTKAQGRTLQAIWRDIDKKGLPREHIIVRFIDRNERTMIL